MFDERRGAECADPAEVAEEQVVAGVAVDGVAALAAEQDVVAAAAVEGVRATDAGLGGAQHVDGEEGAVAGDRGARARVESGAR